MSTLLTINALVPAPDYPGSPAIVIYDNGDWEIAFSGDVEFFRSNSTSFLTSVLVVEFMQDLFIHFDLDDIDIDDDGVLLFLSETVEEGGVDEPVLVIFTDGSSDVHYRETAEQLVATDAGSYNFIPVVELFDDLRSFVSRNAVQMFNRDADEEFAHDDDGSEDE